MPVHVRIYRADVLYSAMAGSHVSVSHDLNAIVAGLPPGPTIQLAEADFVRFKNGGKRLPSGVHAGGAGAAVAAAAGGAVKVVASGAGPLPRDRADRTADWVRLGDVGPYRVGPGNLSQPRVPGSDLEKDHIHNVKALTYMYGMTAAQVRDDAIAIAVPHDVHVGGYTFGGKSIRRKSIGALGPLGAGTSNPDFPNQSRSEWIAANAEPAMWRQFYDELEQFRAGGTLTFELVGSYRYLYKLSIQAGTVNADDHLDALLMAALGQAH